MTTYHRKFLKYLVDWQAGLSPAIPADPAGTAVVCVDLTNGFCNEGALASPCVKAIVDPIVGLFQNAWLYGIRDFVLPQDTHDPDAVEFASFAPHCVRGTPEAETVDELKALPFFSQVQIIEKNSINSGMHTGLGDWIGRHPRVDQFIVVGDCTDLCIYQLAMFLRMDANQRNLQRRVIVPAECVATYDISVETAAKFGIFAHDGDLLHTIFLYHMALNGIEVASRMQWPAAQDPHGR
jgi:nicotinamidase-related amidase